MALPCARSHQHCGRLTSHTPLGLGDGTLWCGMHPTVSTLATAALQADIELFYRYGLLVTPTADLKPGLDNDFVTELGVAMS